MAWKAFNVVGVMFKENPGDKMTRLDKIAKYCHHGSAFDLLREPSNEYDDNAIEVRQYFKDGGSIRLGYVPRELSAQIAPKIDRGWEPVVKFGRKFIDEETTECRGLQLRYEVE